MNPSDYKKVKDIFNSVLEIEPEGRAAFLDDRCDGENGLRDEVERLLASCDSEFLETPVIGPFAEDISQRSSHSGQLIGHYSVITKIGSGGMGDVYLAEDTKLGRRVAIKILPKEFTTDADRLSRFHLEARSASSLTHPNILTIHEIGEWEGTHYIATEYVEGETLRHRLSRGRLTIDESMEYGVQLVSAVVAAHEAGVTHRDIKPENIMIRRDGLVKILDFGLAKFSGSFVADALPVSNDGPTVRIVNTEPGIIMGTVQYMSPEQARGQITDGRTDIWSLGCVLYEMLAGSPPFSGANSADLIAELVKTHPKSLSEYDPEIPERLDEIVAKSLEKNPDERYQTAKDLLIDLKRLRRRFDFEAGSERLDPAVTTDPGNGAVTGANLINTKSGPKDLTTVRGTEYFIWGIKAHRVLAVGIGLLIAALVGGTVYLVRNYWKGPTEVRVEYANKIKLAAQALDTSNLALAKQYLDETIPQQGEEDLRSFEWGYLAKLHAERSASQPMTLQHTSVDSLAYSHDGKTLATAGIDMVVKLWNVTTGEQISALTGHKGWLVSVAFSPDGSKIASGALDGSAKVWDAINGRELFTITGENGVIGELTFSPDNRTLFGADGDKIRSWDASTGLEKPEFVKNQEGQNVFDLSPDGKLFAARTTADDRVVAVWEIASGQKLSSCKGHSRFVYDLKFSPDSKTILTGSSDGTAILWDVKSGNKVKDFTGHTDEVWDVAFSPNGKIAATSGKDDTVKLWDIASGGEMTTLYGHLDDVRALAFSTDNRRVASGGANDSAVRIWNVPKSGPRGTLREHTAGIRSLSFSNDGRSLASASEDKTAKIWDVETEEDRLTLTGHTDQVNSTAFSPNGQTLATGSNDRTVKLWDAVTGKPGLSFDSLAPGTKAVFSPDGKSIATRHKGPEVRLWDAATGTKRCSFSVGDEKETALSVEFSKNSGQVTAGGGPVRLWDASSCAHTWTYNGTPGSEYYGKFAPNSKLIVAQMLNGRRSLKLIDAESGKELASILGHDSVIWIGEFTPDGKRLVTVGGDRQVKVWDVATGQELLSITPNIGEIEALAISRDVLAVGGSNGTIKLWRAQTLK